MTLYSWLYRKAQQFTHKRGWHHMETSRPMPDQGTLHWCKWCGLMARLGVGGGGGGTLRQCQAFPRLELQG